MMVSSIGRRVAPLAALALAALVSPAHAATPADPSGTYITEDGRARVRLEKCGAANDRLCGYVVWLKVPLNDKGEPRVDFKNPDPKKQARPSLGHQLILGLKPNADAHYEGKIYNSEDGKSYDVTIWTDAPNGPRSDPEFATGSPKPAAKAGAKPSAKPAAADAPAPQ